MAFIVAYDANVLYPNMLRGLLSQLERDGLVESIAALRAG